MEKHFRPRNRWPLAADPRAAEHFVGQFAAIGANEAALVANADAAAMLVALGGNSPFLAELALSHSDAVCRLFAQGPEMVLQETTATLAALPPQTPRAQLATSLRRARQRAALAIAVADIGGFWTLRRITAALSDFAQAAIGAAVAHLLDEAAARGVLSLPNPENPQQGSGFAVLGMGKLGARELNFSSDVDLVLLYDPEHHTSAPDVLATLFNRLARALVGLLQDRTADGYVFRVDLRLRPDPGATPLAVALPAALAYYESMGQTWERAAMLKARPIAGDLALGRAFLDAIRPFVWRRHLDFTAIADIHAMKRRIDAQAGPARQEAEPLARMAGRNVKLGRGGIREIEFLVQTLQLIWGGRDPGLRIPATLPALSALARAGHLPRQAAGELARAYRFLRKVEHRLQMVLDRQTHTLPEAPDQLERFATFLGYRSAAALARALIAKVDAVQRHWAAFFETLPAPPEEIPHLYFDGPDDSPATLAALSEMGFHPPESVSAAIRSWLAGRVPAFRSERARDLMRATLPHLLSAFARLPEPNAAFARFEEFLSRLPAGVALLSLFQHHPDLVHRLAAIFGAAPALGEYLARSPAALDGLLAPAPLLPPARLLRMRLAGVQGLERTLTVLAHLLREQEFRLAVASMEGSMDIDALGLARAEWADAVISVLLPVVLDDLATRYGRVRGGGMVVVALGKAGSREMLAGSDLDLMLIYDFPQDLTESSVKAGSSARQLPASQWFIRAAHAFIAALTAPGAEGALYAVDMRLRPSGSKGPVAVSLSAFERYHAESAWTWERMALTRARVITGPAHLRARVEAAIAAALASSGPAEKIRADAAAMRARLARDAPPASPWDVKLRAGGLVEVEFIVQVLELVHLRERPEVRHPTTRIAIDALAEAGVLEAQDAALLRRADRTWRTVQEILRITLGRLPRGELPRSVAETLARALALSSPEALAPELENLAASVRECFIRLVGKPEPERLAV